MIMLLRDLSLAALLLLSTAVFADDSVNTTDTTTDKITDAIVNTADPQKMDDAIELTKVLASSTRKVVCIDNNLPPTEKH